MVEQAFLRLDLHPKDGLPEANELTTIFTDLDTDSIFSKLLEMNHF